MTSKLLLAVQETILRTQGEESANKLMEHYVDIRKGLSFNKSPSVYGAFPTDPYSHTPKGQGAKQPGMTGLVKEEILTRQAELGFFVEDGRITFDFELVNKDEFLGEPGLLQYWNWDGKLQQIELQADSVFFTICQTPVVVRYSNEASIEVHRNDGHVQRIDSQVLDLENSRHIFQRNGIVNRLIVSFHD